VNSRPMLVVADAVTAQARSGIGLSVRVSAHGHKAGRDRLGRITPSLPGRPCPDGRRPPAPETDEVDDDLVRDVTEVLTSFCARLYGRRPGRKRADKVLRCAARGTIP
jgi:predicted site-specific integrase-resolvase